MKALRRRAVLHVVFVIVFAIQFARMAAGATLAAVFVFHVPESSILWALLSYPFAVYMTEEFDLLVAKFREPW
jgi:hypothetical protein